MDSTKKRSISGAGRLRRAAVCALALLTCAAGLPAHAATAIYTVTASKVNVRMSPDTNATVLALVRQGSELTFVSDMNNGWLKVLVNGQEGYVSSDYVKISGVVSSAATLKGAITTDKLNVRAEASSSSKALDLLRKGDEVTVIARSGDWYQVSYDGGKTGYVSSSYVAMTGTTGQAVQPVIPVTPTTAPTAAPTVAPTAAPVYTTTLKEGSKGEEVRAMQIKLVNLGYLKATVDGVYGSSTKSAVRAFQKDHSLTADGLAGPKTRAAIDTAASALSPSGGTTPVVTGTILKMGSQGEDVKALQKNLITLGYLTGSADGKFGYGTRSAVRAFQAASGLTADGEAGEQTLKAITAAISAISAATTLQEGSRGDAVKALQQKLISLGKLTGSADGIYGSSTKAAVRSFQQSAGLTVTGIADSATISAIDTAYQTGTIDPGTHTAPSPVQDPTTTILPSSQIASYPQLKYGDTGAYVTTLQTKLKSLGYLTGNVGENFGTLTQTAVTAFQTANSLKADGIVGTATWAALFSSKAIPAAAGNTLRQGDVSEEVRTMQNRLKALGYLTDVADGEFGSKTKAAVQAFQTKIRFTADGVAGPQTLAALYAADAPSATSGSSGTAPVNPGGDGNTGTKVIRDTDYAKAEQLVALAKKQLGCKYIYAHQAPPYFDCSGLTYYCYKQFGYTLKRTAYAQGYDDTWPKINSISELQLGDLIYFNTNETDSDLSDHAAIYVGDGNFIHASSSSGYVLIQSLSTRFYKEHFSWGRRVFNN